MEVSLDQFGQFPLFSVQVLCSTNAFNQPPFEFVELSNKQYQNSVEQYASELISQRQQGSHWLQVPSSRYEQLKLDNNALAAIVVLAMTNSDYSCVFLSFRGLYLVQELFTWRPSAKRLVVSRPWIRAHASRSSILDHCDKALSRFFLLGVCFRILFLYTFCCSLPRAAAVPSLRVMISFTRTI